MHKIERDHLRSVCKVGQGNECCRYIVATRDGVQCAKHAPVADIIDKRVAAGLMTAQGNNCEGQQGYEK